MLNFLAIDDDEIDLVATKRGLVKAGVEHTLTTATEGFEALRLLRGGEVPGERRIVLLDLNMPRMHGLEFMRELRADAALASTPVVVLTTSAHDTDRLAAHRLHCAGYFLKPVEFAKFVELLQAIDRYWSLVEFAA